MYAMKLNEDNSFEKVPFEKLPLGKKDILVKIQNVGICGSDIAVYNNAHPYKKPPCILGHELCGIVEAIGSEVDTSLKGKKITSASFSHCGRCRFCIKGLPNLCNNKKVLSHNNWQGGFSEYAMLKENMVYSLGQKTSSEFGALVEPLTIGLRALKMVSLEKVSNLAIIGSGNIGISSLIAAKRYNIKEVLMTDKGKFKQNLALNFGATNFVDVEQENFIDYAKKNSVQKADATIVASGHNSCMEEAIAITKPHGEIIVVTYLYDKVKFDLNECVRKEITIKGSALSNPDDFKEVIEWVDSGSINLGPMISHRFYLSEVEKAMKLIVSEPSQVAKVMLQMNN